MVKDSIEPSRAHGASSGGASSGGAQHAADAIREFFSKATVRMTAKRRLIARYFADHPDVAAYASAQDIALRLGVNTSTVTRFAQVLGFPRYDGLRQTLRHLYLRSLDATQLVGSQVHSPEADFDFVRDVVVRDLGNVEALLDSVDATTVRNVAEKIVEARQTLIVAGGSYAAPAHVLAHSCDSMGCRTKLEVRGEPHTTAALTSMNEKDLVIAITFWRGLVSTVSAAGLAAEKGIPLVVMTDSRYSPVASHADHVLIAPSGGSLFYQSMTAPMTLVYCLVHAVYEVGGESARRAVQQLQGHASFRKSLHE